MQILLYLTDFIVPLVIFGIVGYGLLMKVPVYDTFIKGAKKGFLTVIKIMPTLVGLMVAVGILRASGFLELIANGIGRFTDRIGFPGELVPLRRRRDFCWTFLKNMEQIRISDGLHRSVCRVRRRSFIP